jgi:Peptidase A4 family
LSHVIPIWRRRTTALLGLGAALAIAPAARAATTATVTSDNWSGYAVHQAGTTFRTATATWRQPTASCLSADESYSSFWVGVGGYRKTANALEQIGTELDCQTDGVATSSAWYELVPSNSHKINMAIDSGDRLSASVTVQNAHVTVTFADLTRHSSFTRTIVDHTLDVTSAEWIAEAPSDCSTSDTCTVLPLANFGTVQFLRARALSTTGQAASLATSPWTKTKLVLGSKSSAETTAEDTVVTTDTTATPSAFTNGSGGFDVTYAFSSTSAGTTITPTTPTVPTTPTIPTAPARPIGGNPGGPGGPPSFTGRHSGAVR